MAVILVRPVREDGIFFFTTNASLICEFVHTFLAVLSRCKFVCHSPYRIAVYSGVSSALCGEHVFPDCSIS